MARFWMWLLLGILGQKAHADVAYRGFTNLGYIWDQNTATASFQIHDLDLFTAGQIDKQVNYLAEINFQPSFDGVTVDLERTFVQYTVNPWLKIAVGRFHTALGYWNDTYHHGAYLQTAIERPVMERFEDSGGILPVHNTGLEVRGNGPLGNGNLGYVFNIGNGRGPVKDPPSFYFNYSKQNSVSEVVYYEFANGLRVGENFYYSGLPGGSGFNADSTPVNANCTPATMFPNGANGSLGGGNSANAGCGPAGQEYIAGAHVVYNSAHIESLTEYDYMVHNYIHGYTNFDGSTKSNIHLVYTQFGYHIGQYTPFVRYEIDATDHPDAYLNANPGYQSQGLLATTRNYVLGLRYELSGSSALKFEYTYVSSQAPLFFANPIPNPPQPSTQTSDSYAQLDWSLAF